MSPKSRPLERCCYCDEPTGKAGAGEGSLYCTCGCGPFCEECYQTQLCPNCRQFPDDEDGSRKESKSDGLDQA